MAASIKKPRMLSYQTGCSVLLSARDIIHVLAQVKDPTELRGRSKQNIKLFRMGKTGAEDEHGIARRRRTLKVWRRLLMSTASNGVSRGARQDPSQSGLAPRSENTIFSCNGRIC